jgi:DNA-binding winged helix-turn-helix (wHTH) protein/tetratricopeptide (TPR) repeat protein
MSLIGQDLYRFDDFELQPSRRALLRDGVKVPIAPKSFEVLLCLVKNAGRVVLKDELLSTVWPESFVEESNLTQHIFWLRKALADKSGYIETIPGRGYEFTGAVQIVTTELANATSQPAISFTIRQTTEQTRILIDEPPAVPFARRHLTLILSASILLIAAIAGWGVWHWHHRIIPGDHHEAVLADFENTTGDPNFDRSLKTLLTIDLNQSPFLQIAGDSDIRRTLKLMDRPPDADFTPQIAREVCERLNDQVVLSGLIARFGQKYLITLDATDCTAGKPLVQTKAVAATREDVLKAVDSVSEEMRKRLGEDLKTLKNAGLPLLPAHTSSLDALKAFSQARALHVKLKFKDAIPLYQRAIELDPNFADAHAQLANCYNNIGENLKGRDEMGKAYQLRDEADGPDKLRITAMYEYWKTGDRHQAIRNYQAWADIYPLQSNPWVLLGEFQGSVGRMDLSVQALKHAVALNPGSVNAASDLAESQRFSGQLDDAKATCNAAFHRGLDSTEMHRTLLEIAFVQHDTAAFQQQMNWFHQSAAEDDREQADADFDAAQGKMASAVMHYLAQQAALEKDGSNEAAQQAFSSVPQLEAELGMTADARNHLKPYEQLTPLTGVALTAVITAFAETGNVDLAQQRLNFMAGLSKHDSDVLELFLPEGQSAIDLAQAKPAQAVAALAPTAPYENADPTVPWARARALVAASQLDQAAAEFRNIINHPWVSGLSPEVAEAHLGLARVLALQGTRAASRQEYEAFFALFKDADPSLPALKQAHEEYAKVQPILPVPPPPSPVPSAPAPKDPYAKP